MSPRAFFEEVLLERCGAGALCCGYDYRFGAGALGDAEELRRLCGARDILLRAIPEIDYRGAPVSSTRIRQALRDGSLEYAHAMLGRPFGYAFPVEEGKHIGRALGFPTLKQAFPAGFAVPRRGVYASQAYAEEVWRPGVTNIGTRPSFAGDALRSETHVIGYEGDFYGQCVPVRLLRFLRPEIKFADLSELKRQIAIDTQNAWKVV
jgi:riboflavin kinase/FMN adenylyltransferase